MGINSVPYSLTDKRIWVAGHRGMVGNAIMRRLEAERCEILTISHAELDLKRQADVEDWLAEARPDAIFVAAATVGGIRANDTRPAEFLYDNLMIEANVIEAAYRTRVEKLMFLGSACIYPRDATQPMAEDELLSGPLEPTNEWYAIAKIAGIKLCQAYRRQYNCDFISAMPNNLYGSGDNFDLESSHVVPALIRKIHEAKKNGTETVEIWGSGKPLREFLHVEDCADAVVFLMTDYSSHSHVNIGSGDEISIAGLATLIAEVVGYQGVFAFNASMPDGAPRKLLNVSLLQETGWQAPTDLRTGLTKTYAWYISEEQKNA
jgi:GDP-L-fucose synthase